MSFISRFFGGYADGNRRGRVSYHSPYTQGADTPVCNFMINERQVITAWQIHWAQEYQSYAKERD